MKTLTLIIATSALLAVGAHTAGAKNALHCSRGGRQSTGIHVVVQNPPHAYQNRRNLQYFGTWRPMPTQTTCKTLQSAKVAKSRKKAQAEKAKPQAPQPAIQQVIQPAVQITPSPSLEACADTQASDDGYIESGVQSCPDTATAAPVDSSTAASASDGSSTATSASDDSSAAPIVTDDYSTS
jgi:hypothetical protein